MTEQRPSDGGSSPKDHPVLYVGDEGPEREAFEAAIGAHFDVAAASSGEAALALIADRPVAVLVAASQIAGMSGEAICERVRGVRPAAIRVLASPVSGRAAALAAVQLGVADRAVTAPWDTDELLQVIRESVARYHLERTVERLRAGLLERDRLAALAAARAGMLHDLGNVGQMVASACAGLELELEKIGAGGAEPDPLDGLRGRVREMRSAVDYLSQLAARSNQEALLQKPSRSFYRAEEIVQAARGMVPADFRGGIQLSATCPPDLWIWADRTDVSRILLNLMTNACQALRTSGRVGGHVEVRARRDGDDALFLISDNGPGIPPELRARIFDVFYSGPTPGGHGLGLAICRELASANGGSVELSGEGTVGATFALRLPTQKPSA